MQHDPPAPSAAQTKVIVEAKKKFNTAMEDEVGFTPISESERIACMSSASYLPLPPSAAPGL